MEAVNIPCNVMAMLGMSLLVPNAWNMLAWRGRSRTFLKVILSSEGIECG